MCIEFFRCWFAGEMKPRDRLALFGRCGRDPKLWRLGSHLRTGPPHVLDIKNTHDGKHDAVLVDDVEAMELPQRTQYGRLGPPGFETPVGLADSQLFKQQWIADRWIELDISPGAVISRRAMFER